MFIEVDNSLDLRYNLDLHTLGHTMISHIIAFILGIAVATVGFQGVASVADKGVQKVQEVTRDVAK